MKTIEDYQKNLTELFQTYQIQPGSVKARLVEVSMIWGAMAHAGGLQKLPPVVVMCVMSGRSILTVQPRAEGEPKASDV